MPTSPHSFVSSPFAKIIKLARAPLGNLLEDLHEEALVCKQRAPQKSAEPDRWLQSVIIGMPMKRLVIIKNEDHPDVAPGTTSVWLNAMYDFWGNTILPDFDESTPFFAEVEDINGKAFKEWPKSARAAFWNYSVHLIVINSTDLPGGEVGDAELRHLLMMVNGPVYRG